MPAGMPCYGILDITDLVYFNESQSSATNFKVSGVNLAGKPLCFDFYEFLEYEIPFGDKDRARLIFLANAPGTNTQAEIKLHLKKKNTEFFRIK